MSKIRFIAEASTHRANGGPLISRVEIEKETEKFVVINGRRMAKEQGGFSVSPQKVCHTFKEARTFLVDYLAERERLAKAAAVKAQMMHHKARGLHPNDVPEWKR